MRVYDMKIYKPFMYSNMETYGAVVHLNTKLIVTHTLITGLQSNLHKVDN